MRAREFTINIPINIRINGDGDPEVNVDGDNPYDGQEPMDQGEVATNFVPPLQQKIELMKGAAGKQGPLLQQITADDDNPAA